MTCSVIFCTLHHTTPDTQGWRHPVYLVGSEHGFTRQYGATENKLQAPGGSTQRGLQIKGGVKRAPLSLSRIGLWRLLLPADEQLI